MKFKATDHGVIYAGVEYELCEVIREDEDENTPCEEFCSLAEQCAETCPRRKFCEPFDDGENERPEYCFRFCIVY